MQSLIKTELFLLLFQDGALLKKFSDEIQRLGPIDAPNYALLQGFFKDYLTSKHLPENYTFDWMAEASTSHAQ